MQEDHTIVIVGGNMRLEAEGRGQLKGRVITAAGEEAGVTLHDVLIVPDLGAQPAVNEAHGRAWS